MKEKRKGIVLFCFFLVDIYKISEESAHKSISGSAGGKNKSEQNTKLDYICRKKKVYLFVTARL